MRNAMKILRAIVQENEYPDPNISRAICLDMKELQVSFQEANLSLSSL